MGQAFRRGSGSGSASGGKASNNNSNSSQSSANQTNGNGTTQPAAYSADKFTSHDYAIWELKKGKDRLHRYRRQIGIVIEREVAMAKEALKQDRKQVALLALKRKRYQERLLERTEGQMRNMEELVNSIEYANITKQVAQAMEVGNQVLQELHRETSLESVQRLMDETHEAVAYQEEIDRLISGDIAPQDMTDIEDTIRQWEEEDISGAVSKLSEAPTTMPKPIEAESTQPEQQQDVETEQESSGTKQKQKQQSVLVTT